ncbi:MAG: lysophospholipid acyltransferase family protein [Planctomycetes bacterium]|nr:lysophospholipid acyltransferase family protein [Planctomycetota bacterium]
MKKVNRRGHTRRVITAKIAQLVTPLLVKIVARTWRIRWEGEDIYRGNHKNVIISFWHQTIPTAIGSHRNKNICVMVSLNRDGEMISSVATRMGYSTVRGSSSAGGRKAFNEITTKISADVPIAFTPDGPRGPFHSIAPGVLWASAVTGRKIYTFGVAAEKKWSANSWDKMFLAKPFSKVVIRYDSRMGVVDRNRITNKDYRTQEAERLKTIMDECEDAAKQCLSEWCNE